MVVLTTTHKLQQNVKKIVLHLQKGQTRQQIETSRKEIGRNDVFGNLISFVERKGLRMLEFLHKAKLCLEN